MDDSMSGMKPVAMIIINLGKEYLPSPGGLTGDLLFSSPVPVLESTGTSEDVIFPDFQRRSDCFLEPESADATASFVIEKSFAEPQVIEERSYEDPGPTNTIIEEDELQFTVVKGGTSRGKDKLIDSAGFCYTVKNSTAKTINWWCSVRGKEFKCSAAVRERNGDFFRNGVPHNHPGDLGSHLKVATTAKAKEVAVKNIFCPAMGIVERAIIEIKDNMPFPPVTNPSMELIARQANRIRQKSRPDEPTDMCFEKIGRLLDREPKVDGIVIDFEPAMWEAVRHVFPGVVINGCAFHWTQAVWRRVQILGLTTEYRVKGSTHRYIRKLLALPFIPAEQITETFEILKEVATEHLQPLTDYIDRTWINSNIWGPENWCVFGQSVRTNNDVEGWHRRLNFRANGFPAFYNLIHLLYEESQVVEIQVTLVSEEKLRRYQRREYKSIQQKFFKYWDMYRNGSISTSYLLKACSNVHAPSDSD